MVGQGVEEGVEEAEEGAVSSICWALEKCYFG